MFTFRVIFSHFLAATVAWCAIHKPWSRRAMALCPSSRNR